MGITEVTKEKNRSKLYRSEFLAFKARHEFGEVTPPYDASKDSGALAELRSIEADHNNPCWLERERSSSIFTVEAKDKAQEF